MLGNDSVDLRDADARPESFRARFDERVFSADEQRAIAHDAKPLARRWAHWGAKEAAYKLAKQIDPTLAFSPGRFVACYTEVAEIEAVEAADYAHEADLASVSNAVGRPFERRGFLELPYSPTKGIRMLALRSFETADRVHVVAVPAGSDWAEVEMAVEMLGRDRTDPSAAVRELAVREGSRRLGVAVERITIVREGRIPTLELDGIRTSLSLSLSHHGRWIGYAMRPGIDIEGQSGWARGWTELVGRAENRVWA